MRSPTTRQPWKRDPYSSLLAYASDASTKLAVHPDSGFGIVVASNGGDIKTSRIVDKAFEVYLGKTRAAHPDSSSDPSTWGVYTGTYHDPNNFGIMDVTMEHAKLQISFPGAGAPIELKPIGSDFFTFVPPDQFLPSSWLPMRHLLEGRFGGQFVRDESGEVKYFVTRIGVGTRQ